MIITVFSSRMTSASIEENTVQFTKELMQQHHRQSSPSQRLVQSQPIAPSTTPQAPSTTPPAPTVPALPKGKKRGRPSKTSNATREWTDEEVFQLCEVWQVFDNLYNNKHKDYFNRDIRQRSIEMMSEKLGEIGVTATDKHISKKLVDLKNYYGAQRRMVEGSKASGAGADDVYCSPWKFFDALQFLSDAFTPRKTISNVSDASDCVYAASNPPSTKSSKKMRDNENEYLKNIMSTASNALEKLVTTGHQQDKENHDEDGPFCELIKQMLKQVPDCDLKDNLKLEIQQIILRCKRQITRGNSVVERHLIMTPP